MAKGRRASLLLGGVGLVALGGVATWAGAAIFAPPSDVPTPSTNAFVKVVEGTVGSTVKLNSTAEWPSAPAATNAAAGVVTSVDFPVGQLAQSGDVLYTVDLEPIVLAQGAVPSFRDLSPGMEGADVEQLQELLADEGLLRFRPDGDFGDATEKAVKRWEKDVLGLDPTGVVPVGRIVFVEALPNRITLDASLIRKGARLGGGEEVLKTLSAEPTFALPVSDAQASLIAEGNEVRLTPPEGGDPWIAVVGGQQTNADGSLSYALSPSDSGSICQAECAQVPTSQQTLLASEVVTVAEVSGAVVPTAALETNASGDTEVVGVEGKRYAVKVVSSARGDSLVEGVPVGTDVRLPGNKNG